MENNEILNKLLQSGKENIPTEEEEIAEIGEIRIVSIRYKIYSIVLLIVILI
jgi:hypothetical protein